MFSLFAFHTQIPGPAPSSFCLLAAQANKIRLVLAVALALVCSCCLQAQTPNGTIAGSVVDVAGAAVPGAMVTVISLETNEVRSATANGVGGYRIEFVHPGSYRVQVTAPTFATSTVERVTVTTSVVTSANVMLTAGTVTSVLEVSSTSASALKTNSGELSDTVLLREINNLPIATRDPYMLALTLPGVTSVTAANFTQGDAYSVNGNRPRDNNFLVEGVDNNDQNLHGQAFLPTNLEAVEEATFLLNAFSPEFGRGGSVSNLLIKSGTSRFHGAAYERLLNSALDATDHAAVRSGAQKNSSRENIFGFRIGGPIVHDRAFFFLSNQWDRYRASANLGILEIPTAAGHAALLPYAATRPWVANLLQAYGSLRGDPALFRRTVALGLDPSNPATDRGSVEFGGYQRRAGAVSNGRELEATTDFIVTEKDKIRVRFIQSPTSTPLDVVNYPNQLPGFDANNSATIYNAGAVYTHIFSPKVVNELRLAWTRIGFNFGLTPDTYANALALAPAVSIANITTGRPQDRTSAGYGIPSATPQGRFQNTYQLEDAITWLIGNHALKAGFDVADIRARDAIPFNFYGSLGYSAATSGYSSLANFVDDYAGTETATASARISFGNPIVHPEIWTQSYFVQDTWKLRPNLSIDMGLRYEYHGTPFNVLNYPAFDPANPTAFPSSSTPNVRVAQTPDRNNFAPRLGFNYGVNSKTVISGGGGVFYNHVFTNIIDNVQGTAPNTASKSIVTDPSAGAGRGTPNWSGVIPGITIQSALPTDYANVIPAHLLDPFSYQYNLRVQRELPGAFVLALQYVGNKGQKLYASDEFNPTLPGTSTRVIPTRGRIQVEGNSGKSNYNSAQLDLQQKARHGLSFRTAYTYSKLLDTGSEIFTDNSANLSTYAEIQRPFSRNREYGPSAFDHRHRVTISAVYEPPTWHAEGAARLLAAVVNGFTFSGIQSFQSGQPINPEIGADWNGDGINNDRPILGNKNAPLATWAIQGDDPSFFGGLPPGTLCEGSEGYNTYDPCHVVSPNDVHWIASILGTTQNTVGRNSLVADHQSNTDLSVARSFKTFEGQDFMIRVEAINALNHGHTEGFNATLITGIFADPTMGTTNFGDSTLTTTGGRTLRVYARYQF
jgi:hypothetical protein